MDYSFFDALLDSVFVIGPDRGVVYCNEAAAKLCESSVRRLSKGRPLYEAIEFSDTNLFVMPNGKTGEELPAPSTEIEYKLKSGKQGKVQVAIQPFKDAAGEKRWAVVIRDVTLEEVLHAKYHKQLEEKEVYIKKLEEAQAQLEAYSKNLEQMVEERTLEVKSANVMLNAIMNSLGQGFFVFDQKGLCADFFTRACEDILEAKPAGKFVQDVLRIEEKERETFQMWLDSSFKEMLPFDSLKDLGPKKFPHSKERHIQLDYFPLRDEAGSISRIVVVATDQTAEHVAQQALEREKQFARMVVKLVTSKRQFSEFIVGAGKTINQITEMARKAEKADFDYELNFRILHTLEGEAATYSVMDLWRASRVAQEVIEPLKQGQEVDWTALKAAFLASLNEIKKNHDAFMEQNKELFHLVGIGGERKVEIDRTSIEKILADLRRRNVSESVCALIEDLMLKESAVGALRHYDDVVNVVASKLNKKVSPIVFKGEDVRIFLDRYDALFSTFVHAFRNMVDHGIEPPEEREMCGKPASGHIEVEVSKFEATDDGTWLRIIVKDDGKGIDTQKLREKISQSEPGADVANMSDDEVAQYVFASGVSTKEEVGEFSGRGIGMNAIKAEAEALGGTAWVKSEPGRGTKLVVEVPDQNQVAGMRRSA